MLNQLGILLTKLDDTQCAFYAINRTNQWLKNHNNDCILFYEQIALPVVRPCTATMTISEAYGYQAKVIATNLSTASKLINMTAPTKKYFYVYDLEWIRFNPRQYWEAIYPIYGHKDLQLIARSESHKKIIQDCWNRPVNFVMENFDLKVLDEL